MYLGYEDCDINYFNFICILIIREEVFEKICNGIDSFKLHYCQKKKSYISLQKPIRGTQQFLLKCRTDKKKKLRKINNILL